MAGKTLKPNWSLWGEVEIGAEALGIGVGQRAAKVQPGVAVEPEIGSRQEERGRRDKRGHDIERGVPPAGGARASEGGVGEGRGRQGGALSGKRAQGMTA